VKVKNGMVIGTVSTRKTGSKCEFEICEVEEWNELTEEEQDKLAIEAMWDSGILDTSW
jgi:hypothetical protein